jgi:hypothetical protein
MEKTAQGINPATPRDYDKDPIVIEDYNPLFGWLSFKYILFPSLIISIIIEPHKLWMLLILILPEYYIYRNSKEKRKIFLYKDRICYKHNDQLISEIFLEQNPRFFRSFQNYYHKSQDRLTFWHLIAVFLMGWLITKSLFLNSLIFLIVFSIILIAFQITKWIISKKYYRFFHAVLVILDDEVIGISLLNNNDYIKVEEYFGVHGIAMNTLPIYHKIIYGTEKIETK